MTPSNTFWSGENIDPYYAVGTKTAGLATIEEALSNAGLDWTVDTTPALAQINGEVQTIPDRQLTFIRETGQPLDVVSTAYNTVQNREAFAFLNAVADTGEAAFSAAGQRLNGRRVFATMKLTRDITVAGEPMDGYLMFTNSHDGKTAFRVSTTLIRPVCHNMVHTAQNSAATSWRMTHRTDLEGKLTQARESLQIGYAYFDAFEREVSALQSVQVDKDRFLSLADSLLPSQRYAKEKKLEGLVMGWEHPTTPQENNGWQALNAATFFTDHITEYRTDEARLRALETGDGWKLRNGLRDRLLANA